LVPGEDGSLWAEYGLQMSAGGVAMLISAAIEPAVFTGKSCC
jgi:hypothetical protein